MNFPALFTQAAVICSLFTLVVLVGTRDPIKYLFNYPPAIQARVRSLKQYEGRIPTQQTRVAKKLVAALVFAAIAVGLCLLAGADTFWTAFFHTLLLFTIVNLYDLIILDWGIFCHTQRFRIPGTEDMDREYKDLSFHVEGSLRGMLIGLGVSLVVACLIAVLGGVPAG